MQTDTKGGIIQMQARMLRKWSSQMAKVRYVLLLPLTYNDRIEIPKGVRKRIFDDLFQLAGGYRIAGKGKGAYRMKSGEKQIDYTLEVWVVIDEEDEDALRDMVAGFATLLGQEAMYLERVNSVPNFIPPSEEADL